MELGLQHRDTLAIRWKLRSYERNEPCNERDCSRQSHFRDKALTLSSVVKGATRLNPCKLLSSMNVYVITSRRRSGIPLSWFLNSYRALFHSRRERVRRGVSKCISEGSPTAGCLATLALQHLVDPMLHGRGAPITATLMTTAFS